jgi:hypothetical protein
MPSSSRSATFLACLALSVTAHGVAWLGATRRPSHSVEWKAPRRDASAPSSGDTFEIPADDAPIAPRSATETASTGPGGPSSPSLVAIEPSSEPPVRLRPKGPSTRVGKAALSASAAAHEETADEPAGGSLFGAVGDRAAVDLAAAFTRGFPQAASADPLWSETPFGSAGTVDVDLTLDDAGALVDVRTSGNPSHALAEGLRRTLALLRARAFVSRGKETRLRVTATVTPDEVHDGLHGEVFAIGGTFDGAEGTGFFALSIGRRIDVRVRAMR